MAFVGWHGHAPNRDAAVWLMRDILPEVWKSDPSIECSIAGRDWPNDTFRNADPRLRLIGPVTFRPTRVRVLVILAKG